MGAFDGFILRYHSLDCVSDEVWNCLGGRAPIRNEFGFWKSRLVEV